MEELANAFATDASMQATIRAWEQQQEAANAFHRARLAKLKERTPWEEYAGSIAMGEEEPELELPAALQNLRSKAAPMVPLPAVAMLSGDLLPSVGLSTGALRENWGAGAILHWLLMGGRHVDVSESYQDLELVGRAVRMAMSRGVPREEIFLTVKVPAHMIGMKPTLDWAVNALDRLALDYVDLALLAAPLPDVPFAELALDCGNGPQCRKESWMVLDKFKVNGLFHHLGVSHFGKVQLNEILELGLSPPEVDQLEYHPWAPPTSREAVKFCQSHGIAVTAYSPIGNHTLDGPAVATPAISLSRMPVGRTSDQALLRWYLQQKLAVIVAVSDPRDMERMLQVSDFSLDEDSVAAISSMTEQISMFPAHAADMQ